MKGFFTAIIMIIFINPHFSQKWEWIRQYGGEGSDAINALEELPDGRLVWGARFSAPFIFGNQQLDILSQADALLACTDEEGNPIWAVTAAGPRQDETVDVKVDPDGNIIWTGYFWETVTVGGELFIGFDPFKSIFLTKINPEGELEWLVQIGGEGLKGIGKVAIGQSGDIYITGFFGGEFKIEDRVFTAVSDGDFFLAKINAEGNLEWLNQIGGEGNIRGQACAVLTDGSIAVGGQFEGEVIFGDDTLRTNTPDNDLFLARFTPFGEPLWVRQAGGVLDAYCADLAFDGKENLFMTGKHQGVIKLNETLQIQSTGFNDNFYLVSYTVSGDALWGRSYGATSAENVSALKYRNNHLLLSGSYNGNFSIDGFTVQFENGLYNAFAASFSDTGAAEWIATVPGEDFALGNAITFTQSGEVVFGGVFYALADFEETRLNSNGFYDIFLAKLKREFTPVEETPVIPAEIRVYPNPVRNILYLESGDQSLLVELRDIWGNLILRQKDPHSIDMSRYSPGVYWLKTTGKQGQTFTNKILHIR